MDGVWLAFYNIYCLQYLVSIGTTISLPLCPVETCEVLLRPGTIMGPSIRDKYKCLWLPYPLSEMYMIV